MRVAVRKLEGVESVEVSLERGQASIRLRPGNRVTLQHLRQLVKNNGFSSREATVTVFGELLQDGADIVLSVAGLNVVLTVAPDAARPAAYQRLRDRLAGGSQRAVTLDGIVPEPQSKGGRDRVLVAEVDPNVPR